MFACGLAAAQFGKTEFGLYYSIYYCGFAAAQCGKAPPYR
jgi:hypothetical protein